MAHEFHHPNYYKKLKRQAASIKPEELHAANTTSFKPQATEKSSKVQAPSSKPQASSRKRQAP